MAQKTFLKHMTHWGEAFLLLLQVLLNPFEKGAPEEVDRHKPSGALPSLSWQQ